MRKLTRVISVLVTGFAILAILTAVGMMLLTYSKIRKLPVIANPKTFAENFDSNDKIPVDLTVENFGIYDDRAISTYFPYKSMKGIAVFEDPCGKVLSKEGSIKTGKGSKYITVDNLWRVFWIGIQPCGAHIQYFGPYRIGDKTFR